jgi:flagellar operon protein
LAPVQLNNQISGVGAPQTGPVRHKTAGQGDFAGALQAEVLKQGAVKLSAHAVKRLAERNVSLSESEQSRLESAIDRADGKGADKSLVLMDDLALLVSVKNRVVITALDAESAKDGVFTNIDSAIII